MALLGVALLLDIIWLSIYSTVFYLYYFFSHILENLMHIMIILNMDYKNIKLLLVGYY